VQQKIGETFSKQFGGNPLPDEFAVWMSGGNQLGRRVAHLLYNAAVGVHLQLQAWQPGYVLLLTLCFYISVGDPDPDVFGPPGSGSISLRYETGSGSFPFLIMVLSILK
jgi:hypothetical protein